MSWAVLPGCSMLAPVRVARMVGVKIPMPYVPRSCKNQGTEARMTRSRFDPVNSADQSALARACACVGSRPCAGRLKTERPKHHPTADAAWNALGSDQVGGGIIAPEGKPHSHQRNHNDQI